MTFNPSGEDPKAGAYSRRRPIGLAIALTALSVLPNFLLGSLAPKMRVELEFNSAQLGTLIMLANLIAGTMSVKSGGFVQRFGARKGGVGALAIIGLVMIAVSAAQSWFHLAVLFALSGVGAAAAQPAGNLILARQVVPGRQGFAFGVKQASVPLGSLVAGFALPASDLILGWRASWAILGAGVLGCAVAGLWLIPQLVVPARTTRGTMLPPERIPSLITLGVAATFAGAAVVSMGTFLVETAIYRGFSPSTAGLLLSVSSAAAILTRVLQGWWADRRDGRHLVTISQMMLVGALGLMLTGYAASPALFGVGALIGFSIGWGWNGLLHFSMIRNHTDAPASAAAFTQAGLFIGGAAGPLAFGWTVELASYEIAWLAAAISLAVASFIVRIGRRLLRNAIAQDRVQTPGSA